MSGCEERKKETKKTKIIVSGVLNKEGLYPCLVIKYHGFFFHSFYFLFFYITRILAMGQQKYVKKNPAIL